MSGRLCDRVAIVTGAAQGLGRAYATRLFAAGARVAFADIALEAAEEAAADMMSDEGRDRVAIHQVDVCREDQVAQMVAEVERRWGRVDALVNNAGGALLPTGPFDEFTRTEWTRVLDLNLTAQWICAAKVAPGMRRAGYGKIVNVSSTAVSRGSPTGLAPYTAAKAGAVGLTRALARELGPAGIRVNAIAPGYVPVGTRKNVHSHEGRRQLQDRMLAEQCLPHTGTPQDLCGTVEFLCSEDSDFVTGQVVNVDGGWVLN